MNCLDDPRLVDLRFGDGTDAERAHARECEACAARLGALGRDLGRVDAVLRSTPPPRRSTRHAVVWRWAPVAVAAVLALAVALGRRGPTVTVETDDDVLALADELGDAFTADVSFYDDASAARTPSTCTWGDPLLGVGCEQPAMQQIAWR